jgi:hypothetical protein
MNKAPESFLKPLHRHFINLTCLDSGEEAKKQNNGVPAFYVFSAFIVEIDSEWFAVTAGHIFRDIKEVQKTGAKISDWHIDDSTVSHTQEPSYPYQLDIDRDVLYLYDDELGVDYACFKIYDLARQAIATRGIQAIPSEVWSANDVSEYSSWLLIGTPGDGVVRDFNSKQVRKLHATIRLEPVDDIPAGFKHTEYKRHYAKLDRSSIGSSNNKFDIAGMSGGPIFGLKPSTPTSSDQYEYRLVGVQSSRNNTDHIAFCAALPFIQTITQCMAMKK